MIVSDKSCKLLYHGYDQRSGGACCWIKNGNNKITATQYYNSDSTKQIQQTLANGIEHPACEKCWQDEKQGKISKRNMANKQVLEWSSKAGDINSLSLFVGNTCNLSCRTCGTHSSTGWLKEQQYINIQENANHNYKLKKFTADKLDFPLNKLKYIEVLGGEPFYETEHLTFLEKVCQEADTKDIVIFYSTNGTRTIDKEIQKMLLNFKEVRISLSIDAVYKPFSYIRTTGNFEDVESTISYWSQMPNVTMSNHATLSILNLMELKDLYEYFTTTQGWSDSQLSYTYASLPHHYNYSVIPDLLKTKYFSTIMQQLHYGNQHIKSIHNYFLNAVHNNQNFLDFKKHVKYTYEFRKLDITEYLPKLCRVLEL
jgi:organic radical activating enzyme